MFGKLEFDLKDEIRFKETRLELKVTFELKKQTNNEVGLEINVWLKTSLLAEI